MTPSEELAELRAPRTVRARCTNLLEAARRGELTHFAIDETKLRDAARVTAELTKQRYPNLEIPEHSRFSHFDAGGIARLARLRGEIAHHDALERARILTDVVVTSVLLDAGAGSAWRFSEAETGLCIGRSEGLALASLAWLRDGGLSSRAAPYEVDAAGLLAVSADRLSRAFQVSADNPLVGVSGRVHLLRALGEALRARPDLFTKAARPGGLVDHLCAQARDGALDAERILAALLDGLCTIWPGRLQLDGVALGDVWRHPKAGGNGRTAGLVPFHKLSQWLSYSLLLPLREAGLVVRELDALTGLAEYRNGGLFIDSGVLVPKHEAVLGETHEVGSELVVEFRALTVALLDLLAPRVRAELGPAARPLPLAAILEGGTWAAGRELAARARPDGGPPLSISSDGTVF